MWRDLHRGIVIAIAGRCRTALPNSARGELSRHRMRVKFAQPVKGRQEMPGILKRGALDIGYGRGRGLRGDSQLGRRPSS